MLSHPRQSLKSLSLEKPEVFNYKVLAKFLEIDFLCSLDPDGVTLLVNTVHP